MSGPARAARAAPPDESRRVNPNKRLMNPACGAVGRSSANLRSSADCPNPITVVAARYIAPAARKTGKNSKLVATIVCERNVSSLTAMTEASDVNLSIEMASLPSAGTMARSACGMTTRRSVSTGPIPRELAATS